MDSLTDNPSSTEWRDAPSCLNCGARIDSKYCSSCGQKRVEPHEFAIGHFFGHLLHEITHLDSNKIVKTFTHLVARPGYLTREYLAGRKGQYINPIRIYLTVSAVYFLFAWGALASAGGGGAQANQSRPFIISLAQKKGVEPAVMAEKVQEKAAKYSAFLRFTSVLISGLFLMLLYRGSNKYYVEHLIFSLHFYSFDFLAKCIVAIFYLSSDYIGHTTYLISRIGYYFAAAVYLYLALLRTYGQPWPRTMVKAGVQFLLEVVLFIVINVAGFILATTLI